jgi:hypothetical protein
MARVLSHDKTSGSVRVPYIVVPVRALTVSAISSIDGATT